MLPSVFGLLLAAAAGVSAVTTSQNTTPSTTPAVPSTTSRPPSTTLKTTTSAAAGPGGPGGLQGPNRQCGFDKCSFLPLIPPASTTAASSYCSSIGVKVTPSTITVQSTETSTTTTTYRSTVTYTNTFYRDRIVYGRCTRPGAPLPTYVNYAVVTPTGRVSKRQYADGGPSVPAWLQPAASSAGCHPINADITAACSCVVKPAPVTTTLTSVSTVTSTVTAAPDYRIFQTTIYTATNTQCLDFVAGPQDAPKTCGTVFSGSSPTASTTGFLTCTAPTVLASTAAEVRLRVEGADEGTIFEDCIISDQHDVKFANPQPVFKNCGDAPPIGLDILDAAAKQIGINVYGKVNGQSATVIQVSNSGYAADRSSSWFESDNYGEPFNTATCANVLQSGDRVDWFISNDVPGVTVPTRLRVSPDYAFAQAGQGSVTLTFTKTGIETTPAQGVLFAGQTSDANGTIVLPIPSTAGCYQWKGTMDGSIRSNAFYLTVVKYF